MRGLLGIVFDNKGRACDCFPQKLKNIFFPLRLKIKKTSTPFIIYLWGDNMDNNYVYDVYAALAERTIKRLWITCILLIILLVGSNGAWLWYESQFEESTTTTTQDVQAQADGDSDININTVGGDLVNGRSSESKTDNDN